MFSLFLCLLSSFSSWILVKKLWNQLLQNCPSSHGMYVSKQNQGKKVVHLITKAALPLSRKTQTAVLAFSSGELRIIVTLYYKINNIRMGIEKLHLLSEFQVYSRFSLLNSSYLPIYPSPYKAAVF